ncbi:hypothetical protein ACOMHN_019852 [Nucella lapillus]
MQNPSRPRPLTFSHVTRPAAAAGAEETWSSDSDSGITVDSHSPPSKVTSDSGIGVELLSWTLPPPPPSLLFIDDGMNSRGITTSASTRAGLPVTSPVADSDAERQRQQDYVRSTLLEFERQKMLQENRGGGYYGRDCIEGEYTAASPNIYANEVKTTTATSSHHHSSYNPDPTVANDYVPCQMARKLRNYTDQSDVTNAYNDVSERFSTGDFSPPGDDGYGTDSRSNTTGSLASPLSSSLSSLMTDSSSGSQRGGGSGVGGGGGGGGARAQPVASGGRLVIGKRGMLVKRRDLPPVERMDTVSLEDRLRALTTIQEEDSAASAATTSHSNQTSPSSQRSEATRDHRPDPESGSRSAESGSRSAESRSRSGPYARESQAYPEGLYSVISKRPNQLHIVSSSRPLPRPRGGESTVTDRTYGDGSEFHSSGGGSVHRAAPVRVQGEEDLRQRPCGDLHGHSGDNYSNPDSRVKPEGSGSGEGRTEVRFKAGGGGVKLNESGQFEIDYSYYMKASPSESNDEVNTYSPTFTRAQLSEAFREGDSMPPRRRSTPQTDFPAEEEDARNPRRNDYYYHRYTTSEEAEGQGCFPKSSNEGHDLGDTTAETEHVYMNVGGAYGGSSFPQGSLPNLTLHASAHATRRHSGEAHAHPEPHRHSQDDRGQVQSRHKPSLGNGYTSSGGRRGGHGDRNSCDVGSVYRQSELSQTFPPPSSQGLSADRMSLNLGDLPRIQEQLRATSEMLLSSGKRHQFASSSDIYRLFQGGGHGGGGGGGGFAQGRQPPHRRSFHDFNTSPPLTNLAEVRSRVKATASTASSARAGADQSASATSPRFSPRMPLRADHTIAVPDNVGSNVRHGSGRDHVTGRAPLNHVHGRDVATAAAASPGGKGREGVLAALRERLERGQQFSTDVIHSEEGEQLSTLV